MNLWLIIGGGIGILIFLVVVSSVINYIKKRRIEISLFGYEPIKDFRERFAGRNISFFKKGNFREDSLDGSKKLNEKDLNIGTNKNEFKLVNKVVKKKNLKVKSEKKPEEKSEEKSSQVLEEKNKKDDNEPKDNNLSTGKKTPITFVNLEDLLQKVNEKEVVRILEFLRDKNFSLIEKLTLNKTFASMEEFISFLKQELVVFLKDELNSLKLRVSQLRKNGVDVGDLSLRIMTIPLKIRLFESSFSKKDFSNVMSLIEVLDKDINVLEKTGK